MKNLIKSSMLDLILTNKTHKYTYPCVPKNSFVVIVQLAVLETLKQKDLDLRRSIKEFVEQAFYLTCMTVIYHL